MFGSHLLSAACVGLLSVSIAPVYAATTVYSYEGNTFTNFLGPGPWDTTSKVTASITMSSELGPNLNNSFVTPLSWTLSDGVLPITEATATASVFRFSTNAFGDITAWNVDVGEYITGTPSQGDTEHQIVTHYNLVVFDLANDGAVGRLYDATAGWIQVEAGNFSSDPATTQGTWTATVVPIPAAAWLFGSGLIGLIGVARTKKIQMYKMK